MNLIIYKALIIFLFCFLTLTPAAYSNLFNFEDVQELYKQMELDREVENDLDHELNLSRLIELAVVTKYKDNVYLIAEKYKHKDDNVFDHELISAIKISKLLRKAILLTDNVIGVGGVVGLDGVIFSNQGDPEYNITIKSSIRKTSYTTKKLKDLNESALVGLSKVYDIQHWARYWHLLLDLNANKLRRDYDKSRSQRNLYITEIIRNLLGLDLAIPRKALVFIDLTNAGNKRIQWVSKNSVLKIVDPTIRENYGSNPSVFRLKTLYALQNEKSYLHSFVFLTKQSVFVRIKHKNILIQKKSNCELEIFKRFL